MVDSDVRQAEGHSERWGWGGVEREYVMWELERVS